MRANIESADSAGVVHVQEDQGTLDLCSVHGDSWDVGSSAKWDVSWAASWAVHSAVRWVVARKHVGDEGSVDLR